MSTSVVVLSRLLGSSQRTNLLFGRISLVSLQQQKQPCRDYWKPSGKTVPRHYQNFRRKIHFEDQYTVKPLDITNLAGRCPKTGRKIIKGLGGGIKHKYHWINWHRDGPSDLNEKPVEHKVLDILPDGNRTSHVALVGGGRDLFYILATQNMKIGDMLRTHKGIPRIPVLPNEGDCYPLGALQIGTLVNCVEKYIGYGGAFIHAGGSYATIARKEDNRVVLKMPSKREFSVNERCMATVGRLSNEGQAKRPIGSAQNFRLLGYRPASGLWHRKTGKHGRKIKPPKPLRKFDPYEPKSNRTIQLTLSGL